MYIFLIWQFIANITAQEFKTLVLILFQLSSDLTIHKIFFPTDSLLKRGIKLLKQRP